MTRLLPLLAVVLVMRWVAIETDKPLAAHLSYGWTWETCQARKVVVDLQPDPAGMRVLVDCVSEDELPRLLAPGSRT